MRIDVGVLGATGVVGQQLVAMLEHHPWFNLVWLAASERSAGRRYGELPWRLPRPIPPRAAAIVVSKLVPEEAPPLVFSALDAAAAETAEPAFAARGCVVVSNARNYRLDPLVPLVIPEVNPGHLALVPEQRAARGWTGAIVTNPNCSTVFVAMMLAALRPLGPSRVLVTTLQALSGAGHPGVAALDALGNVVPYIDGEEEKIERETRRLLGSYDGRRVIDAPLAVSAQTTRVPVLDGHTVLLSVALERCGGTDEVTDALSAFRGDPAAAGLPTAPEVPIDVRQERDRPQPRLDVWTGGGMTVSCGRIRECPVLGYKLVALGHNTVRGAAGAALLNAELLAREWRLRSSGQEAICPAEDRAITVS